ncbi:MAG: hypothetical protein IT308_07720 [Anaerolineaceae bacterium]|nr:hypothetical protein [Anaerolineaceae bacterium]
MINQNHRPKRLFEHLAALGIALIIIALIDRLTNRLDMLEGHIWDFVYYIDMAENGVWGNDHLASPFAYRVMTPLLARGINQLFDFPTITGFKVIAYLGVWMELWGVYLLARHFKTSFKTAVVVMLVPAFALFNTKFLLFDFYRPDQLGYAFLVFAFLALLKGKRGWSLALSLIGLNTREFLIIPPLILILELFREWKHSTARGKLLLKALGIASLVGFVLILPRLVIPVKFTQQIVDPFNDPNFVNRLISLLTDPRRNFNYLFNLAAYGLPLWMLGTRQRLWHAWKQLLPMQYWLYLYAAVTLIGMMVGGTDMMRYVTYFFIPQALFLIYILRDCRVDRIEIFVMFAAVILFNRILFPFPIWDFSEYVNFYGGYGDWVNPSSWLRLAELLAFVGISRMTQNWLRGGERLEHKLAD